MGYGTEGDIVPGRRRGTPFVSKAQWRWAWATGQSFAREKAHRTNWKSLPGYSSGTTLSKARSKYSRKGKRRKRSRR